MTRATLPFVYATRVKLILIFAACAIALTGCGAGQHPSAAANPAVTPTLGSSHPLGATPAPSISPAPNAETGAVANPEPTAPRLVARDLVWPWLIGMDAHYVYWLNHDPREDAPGYDDYAGHLMRAPRVGGIGETLLEDVVGAKVECGVAGAENTLFLVASGNHTTQSILGVPTGRNGGARTRVFREGVSACNLLASGGRLFWTEAGPGERLFPLRDSEDRKSDGATHASLHSANVDGSDERVLWRSPDERVPLRLLEDGGSLILLLAPPVQEFGLGGLGTLGLEPAQSSAEPKLAMRSSVMTISKSGGTPRELWSAPGELSFAGVDGADLLLCAEDGLYRLPFARAGQASRVWAQPCRYDIQVWKGWGLFGPSDPEEPELQAESLTQRGRRLVLLPILLSPFGFIVEGEDLYVCVRRPKEPKGHCDLVRADSSLLKASAVEGGHLP